MNKPVIVLRCLKCMFSSLSACAFVSICLIIASFVMRFLVLRERKFEQIQRVFIWQALQSIYRSCSTQISPGKDNLLRAIDRFISSILRALPECPAGLFPAGSFIERKRLLRGGDFLWMHH